jgi:polar amino acid transport system substrate-binding protein
MHKKLALLGLTLCLAATCQTPAWSGSLLDKIKQTGVITAGARKNARPFGYVNDKGEWVGYSLDILELIRHETEKRLGTPIALKLVEVNAQNRFDKIKKQDIDIECSSTTFTWEREKEVDFSVSYFASGTQLLVKQGSGLGTLESLAGRAIGVIANTTNEAVMKSQQPEAQLIQVKNTQEGLQKLEKGEIDGFASDGILLEGLKRTATNPAALQIVPDFPYQYESYACLLPQDQSAWRDLVNYTLVKFMEGVVSDQGQAVAIYERWFGDNGVTPYSRDTINNYFQGIVDAYEWIPLFDY